MQNEEFLIKNACYSPAKYYLCKQNNKRSLLGRKQRSQVARSFPNRYQFSCINNVTYLFSIRYTLINIFTCYQRPFEVQSGIFYEWLNNQLIDCWLQICFLHALFLFAVDLFEIM